MGGSLQERLKSFYKNRWFVFVAAMWLQSCAGIGYLYGSISPVIKSALHYNQRQLSRLGVAKDLGDCVGFVTGVLCEILPLWAALLVGASLNFIGYGWVWLIVTGRTPALPLWAVSFLFLYDFCHLSHSSPVTFNLVFVVSLSDFVFVCLVSVLSCN